jgi:outer membrane protein OmpA-like peptidoglycan-associated protein
MNHRIAVPLVVCLLALPLPGFAADSAPAGERAGESRAAERAADVSPLDAPSRADVEGALFPASENSKYMFMQVKPRRISIDVRFPSGSADLTPEAKAQLEGVGKALAANANQLKPGEIAIEGHTDARGSAELNKRLSEQRAQAVAKHLVETYGIAPATLRAVGYGKEQLRDPQRPDAGVNRRVEFARRDS